MKKLTIFITGVLVGSTALVALAQTASFPDVPQNAWYHDAVTEMSELDVIRGNPDGTFDPARYANRAEIAAMFQRYNDYVSENFMMMSEEQRVVQLYYYDPERDEDDDGNVMCSRQGLVPVQRLIPDFENEEQLITETIQLLIRGALTESERDQGITTEFPLAGLSLEDVELNDGDLTLTFDDPENQTVGGSCRVGILWFHIQETAEQFPGVDMVEFMPEELFQP